MKYDTSYGVIPLRKMDDDAWEVFLVQLHQGHWGFPKGHRDDPEESPKEVAERELLEETGLHIHHYLSHETIDESYMFKHEGELIKKSVHYFLAIVKGRVKLQDDELADGKWVALKKASEHLTFPESQNIAKKALAMLKDF